jgi:hypothetical protein
MPLGNRGGSKPGEHRGGRQRSVASIEKERAAEAERERLRHALSVMNVPDPVQFLLEIMRNPNERPARRDRAAKALLPFFHQKLGTRRG